MNRGIQMIKLIKNAQVCAPQPLGMKDVLVVGEKICRIADKKYLA